MNLTVVFVAAPVSIIVYKNVKTIICKIQDTKGTDGLGVFSVVQILFLVITLFRIFTANFGLPMPIGTLNRMLFYDIWYKSGFWLVVVVFGNFSLACFLLVS